MFFLKEKSITNKIIIALVIVILLNFICPNISFAGVNDTLVAPIKDLLIFIADATMQLIQSILFGMDVSFLTINYEHDWIAHLVGTLAGVAGGAVAIAVGIIGAPFTGGLSLAAVIAGIKLTVATLVVSVGVGLVTAYVCSNALPQRLDLPIFVISPREIFEGKIALLDVDFFNPGKYSDITTIDNKTFSQESTALKLQPTISRWYYALRNLAVIILLLILVYIGIRILISSAADDKAKYKQRIMDWVVAMCLLFFMHYIMAFANLITEEITKAIAPLNDKFAVTIGSSMGDGATDGRDLSEYVYGEESKEKIFSKKEGSVAESLRANGIIVKDKDHEGEEIFVWSTNEMGFARIELQLEPKGIPDHQIIIRQIGYTVIYLVLVMYTVLFLFRYLKRVLILAFLTIIAPLMAMTYPLDKLQDGSAQGFNSWLKEYIYNLLIQPVHLILYTVLIGTSLELVTQNLIYAIVALGFILEAEKLIRKFFGFDKASTVDSSSALGGALAIQGISQLANLMKGGRNNKKGQKSAGGKNAEDNNGLRTADAGNSTDSLLGDIYGQGGKSDNQQGDEEKSTLASMVEAEDEKFGTDEYDPQFAEAMRQDLAREEREKNANTNERELTKEERAEQLRDLGFEDKDIEDILKQEYPDNSEKIDDSSEKIDDSSENISRPPRRSRSRNILNTAAKMAPSVFTGMAKKALKATLAATGGGLALAGSIAKGKPEEMVGDVFKGITAGGMIGKGIGNLPEGINGFMDNAGQKINDAYESTLSSEELQERRNQISDRQALNDPNRIRQYQNAFGVSRKEAQEIMQNHAQKYREYGITDDKLIIKAMKAENFGNGMSSKDRILLAKTASQAGKERKKLEEIEKGYKERGVPDEDIRKIINEIKKMNDII